MLECQLLYSLQWSIYVFNSVVNTKLPVIEKIPSQINPVISAFTQANHFSSFRLEGKLKATIDKIWSKISKFCHFIAIYLEKSSKLNLLKEKIEILKRMQYN